MVAMIEAPMVSSRSRSSFSSNADTSSQVMRDCDNAIKAQSGSFERGARAWDIYKAIDGSQYNEKKRKIFKEEDRTPWQFDFTSAKVDTLAGTIIAELPDPNWTPVVGDPSMITNAIYESYINDKDLFNYGMVLLETIRDGCVHSGWYQMTVSKKYHPAGNIAIQRIRPGYFIPDPYWLSSDDLELMVAYKVGYYDPIRMKQVWRKASDSIDRAIYEMKRGRRQEPPEDRQEQQRKMQPSVGDEWRVIEKHYLEIENTVRLVGLRKGQDMTSGKLAWIPFPITEKQAILNQFGEVNNIDWESVQELPFEKRTHKVVTVTDLDPNIILENNEGKVQCNSLPFGHFTTTRVDGMDKGIAETIADTQEMFNERMSHVHELIAKASGGSEVWNSDLFSDPQQKQRFVKMGNKPGHKEFAPLDDVKNIKEQVGHIQVNPAIFQQVQVIYGELLPLISRVSDTMSAMSNSEDTGVLFERKYQMNKIANILFDKFAKQLVNNLGERYFYLWQHVYGGAEREIRTRSGQTIILNKKTDTGMINAVAHVPRCRVVITENTSSATYQMRQRMQVQDIIKSIPENDYLRLNAALSIYFGGIDMDDKDKAKMDMVTEMNNTKAMMQWMTEMSGMKSQMANNAVLSAQAEQMLQKIVSMQQQMGGSGPQMPMEDQITGPEEMAEPVQAVPENETATTDEVGVEQIPAEAARYA